MSDTLLEDLCALLERHRHDRAMASLDLAGLVVEQLTHHAKQAAAARKTKKEKTDE